MAPSTRDEGNPSKSSNGRSSCTTAVVCRILDCQTSHLENRTIILTAKKAHREVLAGYRPRHRQALPAAPVATPLVCHIGGGTALQISKDPVEYISWSQYLAGSQSTSTFPGSLWLVGSGVPWDYPSDFDRDTNLHRLCWHRSRQCHRMS